MSSSRPQQSSALERFLAWLAQPGWEPDIVLLLIIGAVMALVFSNGLSGGFVYDDSKQILQSPLVREPDYFWPAMTQDVWAFRAQGDEVASDYWRPVFMLWLILNHRLWGIESAVGWHGMNLLLHLVVTGLVYGLVRRMGASRAVAAAIAALFALHPTHVESVTWISGSPDLLVALFVLSSWYCVWVGQEKKQWGWFAAAMALFFLSLLAKEIGLFYPALVFITLVWLRHGSLRQRVVGAGKGSLPFVAVALFYFFLRLQVLGQFAAAKAWTVSTASLLLTQPSLIFFYLRQSLFPLWLGPSYPVRAVTPEVVSLGNFWLPLVALLLLVTLLGYLLVSFRAIEPGKTRLIGLGLTLFALFLLPVLSFRYFIPEHIVHDRYLYLPLFGFLLAFVPALSLLWTMGEQPVTPRQEAWVLLLCLALCLPLAGRTMGYNAAWKSDLALWTRGVATDPTSRFNLTQYAYFLRQAGEYEAAFAAAQTVLDQQPPNPSFYDYIQLTTARLEQVDIWLAQDQLDPIDQTLALVFSTAPQPTNQYEQVALDNLWQRAYERLSLRYQQSNEPDLAIEAMRLGRIAVPGRACSFTTNLSVLLYVSGQKQPALAELESVADASQSENTPLCVMVHFYLAQLYTEAGRPDEARSALETYLRLSQTFYDARTLQLRATSQEMLAQLTQPG